MLRTAVRCDAVLHTVVLRSGLITYTYNTQFHCDVARYTQLCCDLVMLHSVMKPL